MCGRSLQDQGVGPRRVHEPAVAHRADRDTQRLPTCTTIGLDAMHGVSFGQYRLSTRGALFVKVCCRI